MNIYWDLFLTFAKVGVKMAQKAARNIEYSYVYGMNIVNIDLDK